MDKELLKSVLKDQKNDLQNYQIMPRPSYQVNDDMNYAFVGVRRAGKSYVLYQHIRGFMERQVPWSEMLYLDFEDNRFDTFHSEDFSND